MNPGYPNTQYGPPPTPPSSGTKTVLIVLGVIGGLLVCCCGACGGITYFGIRAGLNEQAKKVADEVRQHPIVLEKLGGIDECTPNMAASLNEGDTGDVFDVRGPKGKGQIVADEFFGTYIRLELRTTEGEWDLQAEEEEEDHDHAEDMEAY